MEKANLLFHSKHPDGPALGDFRILAREDGIQTGLHAARIDAPAGEDGDVLFAIHREGGGLAEDAGTGGEFPQHFTGGGVEGVELTVVGTAAENESAGGGHHGAPVFRSCVVVGPDALAGVYVPGLDFADVVGARDGYIAGQFARRALIQGLLGGLAGLVLYVPAFVLVAWLAGRVDAEILPRVQLTPVYWVTMGVLPFAAALLATLTANMTVRGTLATRI